MRVFDFLNDELDEMLVCILNDMFSWQWYLCSETYLIIEYCHIQSEGDQFNQGLQPHLQEDTDFESKEDCSSPGSHKGEGDVSSDDEVGNCFSHKMFQQNITSRLSYLKAWLVP